MHIVTNETMALSAAHVLHSSILDQTSELVLQVALSQRVAAAIGPREQGRGPVASRHAGHRQRNTAGGARALPTSEGEEQEYRRAAVESVRHLVAAWLTNRGCRNAILF